MNAVRAAVLLASGAALAALPAIARGAARGPGPPAFQAVPRYDGRLTFARVRYGGAGRRGSYGRGGSDAWSHDYPNADRNMSALLAEITAIESRTDATALLDLEDRAIFLFPILYMSEPGWWTVTDEGAANLRAYLLKGGFVVFDDFDGAGHWENWSAQMRRVVPELRPVEIDGGHAVFRTFFKLADVYVTHPFSHARPTYYGLFEDNDPTRRMLALVNWNADLAEYWEWSVSGYLPIDPTNDAFRVGVNYFLYGLTH